VRSILITVILITLGNTSSEHMHNRLQFIISRLPNHVFYINIALNEVIVKLQGVISSHDASFVFLYIT